MKNLSYKDFFGKEYTHEESLSQDVKGYMVNIFAEENNVSEKSFQQYDELIAKVNSLFTQEVANEALELYSNGKRIKYISEYLYDKLKSASSLNESVIVSFGEFTKKN